MLCLASQIIAFALLMSSSFVVTIRNEFSQDFNQCAIKTRAIVPRKLYAGVRQQTVVFYSSDSTKLDTPVKLIFTLRIQESLLCSAVANFKPDHEGQYKAVITHGISPEASSAMTSITLTIQNEENLNLGSPLTRYVKLEAPPKVFICDLDKNVYEPGDIIHVRFFHLRAEQFFNLPTLSNLKCSKKITPVKDKPAPAIVTLVNPQGHVMMNQSISKAKVFSYPLPLYTWEGTWKLQFGYSGLPQQEKLFIVKFVQKPDILIEKNIEEFTLKEKQVNTTLSICVKESDGVYVQGRVNGSICLCERNYDKKGKIECSHEKSNKVHCKLFSQTLLQGCLSTRANISLQNRVNDTWPYRAVESKFNISMKNSIRELKDHITIPIELKSFKFIESVSLNLKNFPLDIVIHRPDNDKFYKVLLFEKDNRHNYVLMDLVEKKDLYTFPILNGNLSLVVIETRLENSNRYSKVVHEMEINSREGTSTRNILQLRHTNEYPDFVCPGIWNFTVLTKYDLSGKSLFLQSDTGAKSIITELPIDRNSSNTNFTVNNRYGHYNVTNGTMKCISKDWTGPNCLKRVCNCKNNCICNADGKCECDIKHVNDAEQQQSGEVRQAFHSYRFSVNIDHNHGPEFRAVLYYLDDSFNIISTTVYLPNLRNCISKVNALNNKFNETGLNFTEVVARPNLKLRIQLLYFTGDMGNKNPCYLHGFQMRTLNKNKDVNPLGFNFEQFRKIWQGYMQINSEEHNLTQMHPSIMSTEEHFEFASIIQLHNCQEPSKFIYHRIFYEQYSLPLPNIVQYINEKKHFAERLLNKNYTVKFASSSTDYFVVANDILSQYDDYATHTWIFANATSISLGPNKRLKGFVKTYSAPKSVESVNVATYCLTKNKGIYIPPQMSILQVKKQFYLEISIPRSLSLNQNVHMRVVIFFAKKLMKNSSNLVKLKVLANREDWVVENSYYMSTCVGLFSNENKAIFVLKPRRLGYLKIAVSAAAYLNSSACGIQIDKLPAEQYSLSDAASTQVKVELDHNIVVQKRTILLCRNKNSNRAEMDLPIEVMQNDIHTVKVYLLVMQDLFSLMRVKMHKYSQSQIGYAEQNLALVFTSLAHVNYLEKRESKSNKNQKPKFKKLIKESVKVASVNAIELINFLKVNGSFTSFYEPEGSPTPHLTVRVLLALTKSLPYSGMFNYDKVFSEAINYLSNIFEKTATCDNCSRANKNLDIYEVNTILEYLFQLVHCRPPAPKADVEKLKKLTFALEDRIVTSLVANKTKFQKLNILQLSTLAYNGKLASDLDRPLVKKLYLLQPILLKLIKESSGHFDSMFINTTLSFEEKLETACNIFFAFEKELNQETQLSILKWIVFEQSKSNVFFATQVNSKINQVISRFAHLSGDSTSFRLHMTDRSRRIDRKIIGYFNRPIKQYSVADVNSAKGSLRKFHINLRNIGNQLHTCLQSMVVFKFIRMNNNPVIDTTQANETKMSLDFNVLQGGNEKTLQCRDAYITMCLYSQFYYPENKGMIFVSLKLPTGYALDEYDLRYGFHEHTKASPKGFHLDKNEIQLFFDQFHGKPDNSSRCALLKLKQKYFVEPLGQAQFQVIDSENSRRTMRRVFSLSDCAQSWIAEKPAQTHFKVNKCQCFQNLQENMQTVVNKLAAFVCNKQYYFSVAIVNGRKAPVIQRLSTFSEYTVESERLDNVVKTTCNCKKAVRKNDITLRVFYNHINARGTLEYKLHYLIAGRSEGALKTMIRKALLKVKDFCLLMHALL